MKWIRYIHGKRIDVHCSKCDCQTRGTIVRELFRWMVKADCGHLLQRGNVLPLEELERRGYVNQETERDPRAIIREESMHDAFRKQWRERTHYFISKSPYCLIDGDVHTNPLFGISENELGKHKTKVVLELLEAINDYFKAKNALESGKPIQFSRSLAIDIHPKYDDV